MTDYELHTDPDPDQDQDQDHTPPVESLKDTAKRVVDQKRKTVNASRKVWEKGGMGATESHPEYAAFMAYCQTRNPIELIVRKFCIDESVPQLYSWEQRRSAWDREQQAKALIPENAPKTEEQRAEIESQILQREYNQFSKLNDFLADQIRLLHDRSIETQRPVVNVKELTDLLKTTKAIRPEIRTVGDNLTINNNWLTMIKNSAKDAFREAVDVEPSIVRERRLLHENTTYDMADGFVTTQAQMLGMDIHTAEDFGPIDHKIDPVVEVDARREFMRSLTDAQMDIYYEAVTDGKSHEEAVRLIK
jgi:hypothetical protein